MFLQIYLADDKTHNKNPLMLIYLFSMPGVTHCFRWSRKCHSYVAILGIATLGNPHMYLTKVRKQASELSFYSSFT